MEDKHGHVVISAVCRKRNSYTLYYQGGNGSERENIFVTVIYASETIHNCKNPAGHNFSKVMIPENKDFKHYTTHCLRYNTITLLPYPFRGFQC